jgi:hypothetical protein
MLRITALLMVLAAPAQAASTWVFFGPDGKLSYRTDGQGNRVMDFSTAGYHQGGVPLPVVAAATNLTPSGGDDTAAIQAALDGVSALPLDASGARGAVVLGPGTFTISTPLTIAASGVVLRGSGSTGTNRTTIAMTGATGYLAISVAGIAGYTLGATAGFVNQYVPSGTASVAVTDASAFAVGDPVLIQRTVTAEWIHFVGMDTLVRDGLPQTWIAAGTKINTDRTITAINGNTLVLDAPLTDSFDPVYLGDPPGTVSKYTFDGRISEVGVEHLRILAPSGIVEVYGGVTMRAVKDGWVSDVVGQETQNAFNASTDTKQITFDHVINNVSVAQTRSAATGDFSPTGSQILLNWCQSNGSGDWAVVTGATGTGPVVILNFGGTQTSGISPHQRWTTGMLTDSASVPNATSSKPGIAYRNRTTMGSGHGWTTGWSVAWNAITPALLVTEAPGTINWCLGCKGSVVASTDPSGIFESTGTLIAPDSLYLQQLRERLGDQALVNIGAHPYTVSAAPPPAVPAGNAASVIVTYTPRVFTLTGAGSNGVAPGKPWNGTTTFSVTGLPAGASATFSAPTRTTAGTSTLQVTTSPTTPPGDYPLAIKAASALFSATTSVTLTVTPPPPTFVLGASPTSQTVVRGNATSYTVTATPAGGFTGTVALSVSGLPTGASGTFAPTSIAGGAGSSVLTVTTTTSATTGSKTFTITGTSGTLTRTTTATLVVNTPPAPVTYEAEASGNTLSGGVATGACSGCSGGTKVRFIGSAPTKFLVINNIASTAAGTRTLKIYPVVSGTRAFSISVNGGPPSAFSSTGTTWTAPAAAITTTITVNAGANTIKFFNDTANAPDLDRITVQ